MLLHQVKKSKYKLQTKPGCEYFSMVLTGESYLRLRGSRSYSNKADKTQVVIKGAIEASMTLDETPHVMAF